MNSLISALVLSAASVLPVSAGIHDFNEQNARPSSPSVSGKCVTMRDKRCNSSCSKLQIFDPQSCETPVRENVPNSLAGDQTWPTELELVEATEEIEDAVRDDLLGTESKEQYDDQAALIPVSEIQIDRNDHNGFVEPAAIHP